MALSGSAKEFGAGVARLYRRYAEWLVSITWKRFFVLSILVMILAGILSGLPPFSWDLATRSSRVPASRNVDITIDEHGLRIKPKKKSSHAPEITIDENGIRIKRRDDAGQPQEIVVDQKGVQLRSPEAPPAPPAAPSAPAAPKPPAAEGSIIDDIRREVVDNLRREMAQAQREAAAEARREAAEARRQAAEERRPAIEEAKRDAEQAKRDAEEAKRDAEESRTELAASIRRDVSDAIAEMGETERTVHIRLGNYLPQFAFLFILLSAAIKIAYAGRVKAEAKAAEAQEVADEESLKRQVVEARMAAMQAQVEPHFLFNTLASIDHLIETDPARASRMQKNLIALLRASMPAMRESTPMAHNLGREMAVIRPYLEILKVRMEDRLQTSIMVPDGLLSAEFPPMMIQSLVENAIKHGLEPKAEGGKLTVKAEIVHGKLAVTVADTGLGFGKAATAGTGVGLANIRERLKLLYGDKASMVVADNQPSGTIVTLSVPYMLRCMRPCSRAVEWNRRIRAASARANHRARASCACRTRSPDLPVCADISTPSIDISSNDDAGRVVADSWGARTCTAYAAACVNNSSPAPSIVPSPPAAAYRIATTLSWITIGYKCTFSVGALPKIATTCSETSAGEATAITVSRSRIACACGSARSRPAPPRSRRATRSCRWAW
jgi:hypothetical protein